MSMMLMGSGFLVPPLWFILGRYSFSISAPPATIDRFGSVHLCYRTAPMPSWAISLRSSRSAVPQLTDNQVRVECAEGVAKSSKNLNLSFVFRLAAVLSLQDPLSCDFVIVPLRSDWCLKWISFPLNQFPRFCFSKPRLLNV